MRSLFLVLLLLDLLFLALQLDLLGISIHEPRDRSRLNQQSNAERLRIVREPAPRARPTTATPTVRSPE